MKGFTDWFVGAYAWLKDHDLPNTFTFVVTIIFWPLALLWWAKRKVNNVSKLLVAFTSVPAVTMSESFPAVAILFENQTGSVVYLNGPQIRNCSKRFTIPTEAVRDIGENAHPLSFLNRTTGVFQDHQATLQTSDKAQTVIAVTNQMPESFYRYKTPFLRRVFRRPKYFIMEYTAMVGEKRYSVSTIY